MTEQDLHTEPLRQYLTRRREHLGLTQAQIARAIGTQQSAVSEMERGITGPPNLDTLSRWARALELQLSVRFTERVDHDFEVTPGDVDVAREPAPSCDACGRAGTSRTLVGEAWLCTGWDADPANPDGCGNARIARALQVPTSRLGATR